MRRVLMTAISAAVIAMPTHAQIYKCVVEGKTVFSQTQCAPDAQAVEVKVHAPDEAAADEARKRAEEAASVSDAAHQQVRKDSAIEAKRYRITQMEKARDAEVAEIRARRAYANNNLAGAEYLQSLSQQEGAAVNRHNADIEAARRELEAAQKGGANTP